MISDLPYWISALFLITCLIALVLFHFSNGKPNLLTLLILLWSLFQLGLSYEGFYLDTNVYPVKFLLVVPPPLFLIVYAIIPNNRRWVIKKRNLYLSTLFHVIRFPVEIVLVYLFFNGMVPEIMTFKGANFDILIGITAPLILFLYKKNKILKKGLLLWNIIGLTLVIFVFFMGIFSGEMPIQIFGFEQPNKAVQYFPFILLPATIVPLAIYLHVVDIFKLLKQEV